MRRLENPTPIFILIVFAVGLVIYSNSFQASFHLDDASSIVENTAVWHLSDVGRIWTEHHRRFIPYLSFAINYQLSGLHVFSYHLFNVIIHVLSALMVYFLVRLLFKTPQLADQQNEEVGPLIAFSASLIFLVHPIQTQAVTYIVQRIASLAGFFYLASTVCYFKTRLEGKLAYYALAFLTAAFAMFTRETSYTLPLALLLFEAAFFSSDRGRLRKALARLLPFFFLWVIVYFVCYHGNVAAGELGRITRADTELPRNHYLLTQINVLRTYVRLLFLPVHQNLDYDYPISKTLFEPKTTASLLFLIALFLLALKLLKRHRFISFGIFWFFLTLSVESSIFPIDDAIFEHRLYLPMFGLALAVSTGLYSLMKNPKPFIALISLIVLVLSTMTYLRNRVWKDEMTLWQDVLRKSPKKARAYDSLGVALGQAGKYEESKQYFDKVIELDPKSVNTYNSLGVRLAEEGNYERAMEQFNKAIEIDPQYVNTYNSLGILAAKQGKPEEAIRYYELALKIKPDFEKAYYNKGISLAKLGRMEEAIQHYRKAIEIKPDYEEAHFNLANMLADQGKIEEALWHYQTALKIKPDYAEARTRLGILFYRQGKLEEAIQHYREAIRRTPDYAEAHNNMGVALAELGKTVEAIAHFKEALRLKPDFESVRRNLETLLQSKSNS